MSAKLKITTRVRRLIDYIGDVESGLIQIPGFQRDFVWTLADMIELFNSLKMGYPIGTILLWRSDRSFGENKKIGPYYVPQNAENFFYVLDGFQRITTLIGCLINPSKTSLDIDLDVLKNFRIYYDLKTQEFAPQRSKNLEYYQVPVYKLIDNRETFLWQRTLFLKPDEEIELLLDRYEQIGNTLLSFYLPSIDINGGTVDEAVDIFWRLNSKGSVISLDWIVSARTFDNEVQFRLGTEIDNLLGELRPLGFGNIKRELVLQCIQSSFGKLYFEMSMDALVSRSDFREVAFKSMSSIKKAVKFLYEELLVVDSKLLPASMQLIFITEFFNRIDDPSSEKIEDLKKWFWQTSYSNYFTVLSPSKRKEAFNQFILFLDGASPVSFYNDKPDSAFVVGEFPNKIYFGSVRVKSLVLFLINYSNNFRSINYNDVQEIYLTYLFYDLRNSKGDYDPASAVPIIDRNLNHFPTGIFKRSVDASQLLKSWRPEYTTLFLTKDMADLLENDLKEYIINIRKELIIEAERYFVQSLGLIYNDPAFSTSNS